MVGIEDKYFAQWENHYAALLSPSIEQRMNILLFKPFQAALYAAMRRNDINRKEISMKLAKIAVLFALSAATALAIAGEIKPYSQARFDKLSADGKPVLLAIHASWCPTCKAQKPIIDELMKNPAYKDVTTLKIDFDTDKPLLKKYKVGMQSTLIGFKGSQEVGRSVGDTSKAGIENLIKKTIN